MTAASFSGAASQPCLTAFIFMRSFPASLRGPVERCELRRAASSRWGVRQVDLRKRHSNSMNWKIGSRGGRGAVPTRNETDFHRPYSYQSPRLLVK